MNACVCVCVCVATHFNFKSFACVNIWHGNKALRRRGLELISKFSPIISVFFCDFSETIWQIATKKT